MPNYYDCYPYPTTPYVWPKWFLGDFSDIKESAAVSELKVTKERVVAAAAKCGDAARVLKELFPEAFVKPLPTVGARLTSHGDSDYVYTYLGRDKAARQFFATRHGFEAIADYGILLARNGDVVQTGYMSEYIAL